MRRKMRKTDCDLLLWIVSSHGGIDEDGPFFLDSDDEKVYQYQDWIYKMAVDDCPAMEKKRMIFFPIYCRNKDRGDKDEGYQSGPVRHPISLSKIPWAELCPICRINFIIILIIKLSLSFTCDTCHQRTLRS